MRGETLENVLHVLHTKNLEMKNGVVYLPLYMTPLVATGAEDLQATKET